MPPFKSLAKNALLAFLPPKAYEHYFSSLPSLALEQGHMCYRVGAPIEHVYFMESGVASVVTTMETGATVEVGMVGSEGMIGMQALMGMPISEQDVVIQVPGSARRMSASACKAAFDESAEVRKVFLRFTAFFMHFAAQSAACNRLHTVEQRMGRWLLLSDDRVQSDVIKITHEFLATMLGVRRTGVTEVAGELQRRGLIRYHHGKVSIIDRPGLEAVACECYTRDRARFEALLAGNAE